ncbi:MAG: hypothetical protein HY318_06560 [Armatimonadetes bacterium]|nr:hypothetical protein [Armatimonadota bacterium]
MRWIRHPVTKVILVCITIGVIVIVSVIRKVHHIPSEALQPSKPSATEATAAATRLWNLRNQWVLLEAQRSQGVQRPFQLRVTETDLNTFLRSDLPAQFGIASTQNLPLRNPRIKFGSDGIEVSGLADHEGRAFFVTVIGSLQLVDATTLRFSPASVKVGDWSPPGFVEDKILQKLRDEAYRHPMQSSIPLKEVKVEPGALVVRG